MRAAVLLAAALFTGACSGTSRYKLVHSEIHAGTSISVRAGSELPTDVAAGIAASVTRALDILTDAAPGREPADVIKLYVLGEEAFNRAYGHDPSSGIRNAQAFTVDKSSPYVVLNWTEPLPNAQFRHLAALDVEFNAAHETTHAWLKQMGLDAGVLEEGLCQLVALRASEPRDGIELLTHEVLRAQAARSLLQSEGRFPWDWLSDGTSHAEYDVATLLIDRVSASRSGALPLRALTATPHDLPATKQALEQFASSPMSAIEEDVRAWASAATAPYREGDWARTPDGSEIAEGFFLVTIPADDSRRLELHCRGADVTAQLSVDVVEDGVVEIDIGLFELAQADDAPGPEAASESEAGRRVARTSLSRAPGEDATHVSFVMDGRSARLTRDGEVLCELPLTGSVATVTVFNSLEGVGIRLARPLAHRPAPEQGDASPAEEAVKPQP